MNALQRELKRSFGDAFEANKSLLYHSTLRTGGVAKYYFSVRDLGQLEAVYRVGEQKGLPCLFLGRGSNVIIRDEPLDSFVICLGRFDLGDKGAEKTTSRGEVIKGFLGGFSLSRAMQLSQQAGWVGMEFASGIPGTIGGAVKMNAGTRLGEVKDVFHSALVFSRGRVEERFLADLGFEYRSSLIGRQDVVLLGRFCLRKVTDDVMEQVKSRAKAYMEYRRSTQPLTAANVGSTFKNPMGMKAAGLIERAGLKGKKIGKIHVSTKHTNFIINEGGGTARQAWRLIELIREEVERRYGVVLDPEVYAFGD